MSRTFFEKTGLTGGGANDLDGEDGNSLNDGDFAIVNVEGTPNETHMYVLDADSGKSESSPAIIVPDSNPGSKCWILYGPSGSKSGNLLTNTQWTFCSNSDTNKGIATMAFDSGSEEPSVGDQLDGATSSATGKVISVTKSSGTWAGGDAAGTIELGACAGRFHDNEDIDINGGTANVLTVNQPNSAAGVDLVQNGEFSTATTGWTAGNNSTLSSEAGGQVGNCVKVLESGSDDPQAFQSITVEAGKIYYLSFYHKDIDSTGDDPQWALRDVTNSAWIKGYTTETAAAAWTQVTWYFAAPSACTEVRIYLQHNASNGDGDAYYFDEVSCYEMTSCCTGSDVLAFDGWNKGNTTDLYRIYNDGGTNTKDGSFYSLMLVPSAAGNYTNYPATVPLGSSLARAYEAYWYQRFAGKVVCFGCWLKTSTASHARLRIYDGTTETYSSYHTGGGSWEWIEVSATISASPTLFNVRVYGSSASLGSIYISQPILIFGSSIGQGNYMPEADKMVYFENDIASQSFNAKTGANGFSDVSVTELNLEADSRACIGKGVKAVRAYASVNDDGSNTTDCYFQAGQDISAIGPEFVVSPYGLASDKYAKTVNMIPCNSSGNYEYQIEATGANKFDINAFKYIGGEWR